MKYAVMFLLMIEVTFSQIYFVTNGEKSGRKFEVREDLNSDGTTEYLQGESIIKIGEDSYWVRRGQLVTGNGTRVFDFREKIYLNGRPLIEQVNAIFGYIITFRMNDKLISVYISDELGSKASDELILIMD